MSEGDARQERMATAGTVAEMLNVPKSFVYRLCRQGKIPHTLIGSRCYRFSLVQLQTWIAEGGSDRNAA